MVIPAARALALAAVPVESPAVLAPAVQAQVAPVRAALVVLALVVPAQAALALAVRWAVVRQVLAESPSHPHGHGLVAATSVKRAGYVTDPPDLVMVTRPVSRGWRRACSTGA